jgi:hypothetical protein|tara:strand:- start:431 stop:673 length:243 start_codon:yes stop_codon:yes gene_type:complete
MNLFRSEEHVRSWSQFNPDSTSAISTLEDEVTLFNIESNKHKLDGDYISQWLPKQAGERASAAQQMGKTGPFWPGTSPNP